MSTSSTMSRQLRVLFLAAAAVLAIGFVALRRGNTALEARVATGNAPPAAAATPEAS